MSKGNFTEAWKAVIDFSKSILTFASAVTVASVGYYLANGIEPTLRTMAPIGILLASAILALYGFGRAIVSVHTGKSRRTALKCCNGSAIALLIGILCVFLLRPEKTSVFPVAYDSVQRQLTTAKVPYSMNALTSITYRASLMSMMFCSTNGLKEVVYDTQRGTISSLTVIP